jgi:hypothetical protein
LILIARKGKNHRWEERMFTNRLKLGLVILLLGLTLAACGPSPEELEATSAAETAAAATSTPTITPTFTPTPTPTLTPLPSNTPQPTLTPSPAPEAIDGPKLPYSMVWPGYAPEEIWEGFPIHPDAVKGQEYMGGYIYSTYQTAKVIKEYYLSKLEENGWQLTKYGEVDDGSLLLIFQKEDLELSITILNFGVEFDSDILGKLPPRSIFLK